MYDTTEIIPHERDVAGQLLSTTWKDDDGVEITIDSVGVASKQGFTYIECWYGLSSKVYVSTAMVIIWKGAWKPLN